MHVWPAPGHLHALPVRKTARLVQPGGKQIARAVEQLPGGELAPKKLHANLIELVRFVEHHHAHARQQLGHTGFTHPQVGKKQMVVDHHHIGRQRLAPRQVHMALRNPRALGTQAVFTGRSDQRNDRRALVQRRHLSQVTRARALRPSLYCGQRVNGLASLWTCQHGALARHFHSVQAKVTAAPLEQCRAQRQAQSLHQHRQIACKQLVLQRLGGR